MKFGRGFFFTLDAVLALLIIIGCSTALTFFLNQNENLNHELLFQLSQDMMEVCARKADFSKNCFDFLNKSIGVKYSVIKNGKFTFGDAGEGEVRIVRHFAAESIELRTWTQ